MGILRRLARSHETNELPIALIGMGFVGQHLVHQLSVTPGMRTALVVNRSPERACTILREAGVAPGEIVVDRDPQVLNRALTRGIPAVTDSVASLREIEGIACVVEASGSPEHGAVATRHALEGGHDVVSMNAEADATIGYLLHTIAQQHNAIYTLADGDQPGVLARLIEFVEFAGFEVFSAINCKGFMDVEATPESVAPWAEKQRTSPVMTTAFADGTKMNIENACVANAFGLKPDKRGMHGVKTDLSRVPQDIVSVLQNPGTVEYTLGGDFGGGVMVIGYREAAPFIQPTLNYLRLGDGPFYAFFRPYHLVHLETPVGVAEVCLDHEPLLATTIRPATEVVAIAKKDLAVGDIVEGIGGREVYGEIDLVEHTGDLVPIGLTAGARVTRPVPAHQPIPATCLELAPDNALVRMRREQDALLASEGAGR